MIMCEVCGHWMVRKYVSEYGFCYYYDYCSHCEEERKAKVEL